MATVRRSTVALASTLAASAMTVWACSFPEIRIAGESGGAGGASSSSSISAGGSGGSGGATSSSSSTSSSSASSSSSTTSTSSSSSSSSTSSSSSSTGGPCTTDVDGDDILSWKCDPADPALDCADEDGRAHPGATFQGSAIMGETKGGTLPFDFDCNGSEQAETPVRSCPGSALNCPQGNGFEKAVACGASAPLGHCVPSGLVCAWAALNPAQTVVQRCK